MSARFDGKVVLVTGAARGQGRAHALRFAAEGASVTAIDACAPVGSAPYPFPGVDDLFATAAGDHPGRITPAVADVRDLPRLVEVVDETVEEHGRLDVVVVNAGISTVGFLWELDAQAWQDTIDINLTGAWNTIRAAVPRMIAAGHGGSIVFTSSFAGLRGMPGYGHYAASKHGVVGLARSLAIELGPHSIRVNTVHPTGVDTPMITADATKAAFHLANPVFFERPYHVLPVGLLAPDDVADAVLWLASDEARYVTATTLTVDAGATQL